MFELVPLKPNSLLICRKAKLGVLRLLLNIVNEAIEACETFLQKEYTAFDAQVGETSCQIRAYKICLLAYDQQFIFEIQNLVPQILEYKKGIINYTNVFENNMMRYSCYFNELDKKESKESFFNRLQFILPLKDDCLFIILSYFLNKYCFFANDAPNAINYSLIKKSLNIRPTVARNLANHYQLILSKLSCDFIFQQATFMPERHKRGEILFLQYLLRLGDGKRYSLPYYLVTKILMVSSVTTGLPIVFSFSNRVQNKSSALILFFKKDNIINKMKLQLIVSDEDKKIPVIVFRGEVVNNDRLLFNEEKKSILKNDIRKIILLNAAIHPQYAGEKLNNYALEPYKDIVLVNKELEKIINSNCKELINLQIEAEAMGCSIKNPSLFYIKHIFCSTFFDEYNSFSMENKNCY